MGLRAEEENDVTPSDGECFFEHRLIRLLSANPWDSLSQLRRKSIPAVSPVEVLTHGLQIVQLEDILTIVQHLLPQETPLRLLEETANHSEPRHCSDSCYKKWK